MPWPWVFFETVLSLLDCIKCSLLKPPVVLTFRSCHTALSAHFSLAFMLLIISFLLVFFIAVMCHQAPTGHIFLRDCGVNWHVLGDKLIRQIQQ